MTYTWIKHAVNTNYTTHNNKTDINNNYIALNLNLNQSRYTTYTT